MSLHIRQAGIDDLPALVPLFDAYRQFYQQPSDPVAAHDYLLQRLQRQEALVLLAELDQSAVGFTLLYPGYSSVGMARVHVLNDLFVAAHARRLGVGLALLDAAADLARKHGMRRISLETAHDNLAAQALYRRAGWCEDHTQWFHLEL